MKKNAWFAEWFDSAYYHQLYNHRNEAEAQRFIDFLLNYLQPSAKSRVLDLACGKGRHSIYMAQKNLCVMGVDLSPKSIAAAKEYENSCLEFAVQDMRRPLAVNYFDYVFSFFTSFGYFNSDREHQTTLNSMAKNLRPQGILVIDFLNVIPTINKLVANETVKKGDIEFVLHRFVKDGFIQKQINFNTPEGDFTFTEKVRTFGLADFEKMLAIAGFNIQQVFGDYELRDYEAQTSPRLIIVARKH
jgi:SAM-dependent methyltransferase